VSESNGIKSIDDAMAGALTPCDSHGVWYWDRVNWKIALPNCRPIDRCDYATNSVVASCLNWICDQRQSAELTLIDESQGPDQNQIVIDHPALILLNNPYPQTSFSDLFSSTIRDYKSKGDALWYLPKSEYQEGIPNKILWIPWRSIKPVKYKGSINLVDEYEVYHQGMVIERLPAEDCVRFRDGFDETDRRYGQNRLDPVKASIDTISRAEVYTLKIITRGGPLKVFIPDNATGIPLSIHEITEIKKQIAREIGESAEGIFVAQQSGRLEQVTYGPQEMAIGELQDRPECNICSALGVNPIVIGLLSGALAKSYANQHEADEQSWVNGIVPLNKTILSALNSQYLPMFGSLYDPLLKFDYNYTDVDGLSRFVKERQDSAIKLAQAGLITKEEARTLAGYSANVVGDEDGGQEVKYIFGLKNDHNLTNGWTFKRVRKSNKIYRYAM
jgi:phage portal protein BeeE